MSKVSVLIPVYNVSKYLSECLDSVISQTFEDIEIICVDDGSTDNSFEIISSYAQKDPRIRPVKKVNSGYGATLNLAIGMASSDYIAIVESDDFIAPNVIKDLYELVIKNDADVARSNFFLYWGSSNKFQMRDNILGNPSNKLISIKEGYYGLFWMLPALWSGIYKKKYLDTHRIRFLETPGASYQDTSFFFKVIASGAKVVLTTNAYIYYRQDNEASSVNSKDKAFCIIDEFSEVFRFLKERGFDVRLYSIAYRIMFGAYWWNLNRITSQFKMKFLSAASAQFREGIRKKMISRLDFSLKEILLFWGIAYTPRFILLYMSIKKYVR